MTTPTYRSALYKSMQNAADIAGANVKATFSRQVDALIDSTSVASIKNGISGGIKGVVDSVDWAGFENNLREEYERRLARAMKEGADQFKKQFPDFKYDPTSKEIQRAINKRARELSSQLVRESKKGFRQAVRGLFREGAGKFRTAAELKNMIGLTRKEAQAVINARAKMLEDGVKVSKIDKRSDQLIQKYRRQRAARISRTSGVDIANKGQDLALRQAIKVGDVEKEDIERVWIISSGACEICAPMSGQVRDVDKPFITGEGVEVDGPTVHQNCYCSVAVRIRRQS